MPPPLFSSILGQSAPIQTLQRAYLSDHLPHGLIFAGPTGVGKALTARALASLFLCPNPRQTIPCGKCESCTLFTSETHPDFHLIYRQLRRIEKETSAAKLLSIEVIREYVVAPANHTPILNHGKVFLIKEADLMTPGAQNSLLKTLEEPAGPTLIILLTDQPNALLPTIRSRCQLIPFSSLDPAIVRSELEKRGIDPQIAQTAASLSEGSLGLALAWIEDDIIPTAQTLHAHLSSLLAGDPAPDLESFFKSAAESYADKQLKHDSLASKDQSTREGLALYLRLASQFFRRHLAQSSDPQMLDRLCSAIEALIRSESNLQSNVNIPLTFQQLSLTLHRQLRQPA